MASMPTQVQVIQQPMNSAYLQQLYSHPGQVLMGNVMHQQGLGGPIQVIAAGKPLTQSQLPHMLTSAGAFPAAGYTTIPTSNNGTLVMLSSQANILPSNSKPNDLTKVALGQRLPLHAAGSPGPKQLVSVAGSGVHQHQVVTSQAGSHHMPMIANSSQIFNQLQAFGQMPQAFGQMPQALFQNPIYIRPSVAPAAGPGQAPQEGMFLQSPPAQQQVQQQQVTADPNQLRFSAAVATATTMTTLPQTVPAQPPPAQQAQPQAQPAAKPRYAEPPSIQPRRRGSSTRCASRRPAAASRVWR
ncbi:nucleosome-remodeling factor subunit BPTF-like [Pollicipes pollicipes]|uniref:nucleosome-remodeling factor subunit BPTF-like n=1 Tax=Pollicipes pollicipes TaxID=41117 RepID=UPI001884CBA1|nr:nucleosome-remodeling factor subunit BPTF-like [Pollicipes pollicipes]